MILDLDISSGRKASVQSSITTSSTLDRGEALASRAASDRPDAPPAQPSPKTGTRCTFARKPIPLSMRASIDGVAMPVEDTVTMVSISDGLRRASASARLATRAKRSEAPVMKAAVRSGQPCSLRNHS